MRPEDLLEITRKRPFEPFRIHISGGSEHEIHHPDMIIVQRSRIIVGVPGPDGPDGPTEKAVHCALIHVTRVEPVNGQSAPRKRRRK